ncbi:nucleoside/nucleotide kinase family protein [Georgenia sunbinii]|uniref:nucleoside/nucleotide kinase family protein n=1 Tax=Georgenia sunbinii TaxID=3117728 RepID=UPI002F26910C
MSPGQPVRLTVAELVERAGRLVGTGGRRLLGIVGAPGAGKSTLASRLVVALGTDLAVAVGMDGFHLSNAVLRDLGRHERKGAIDTFDSHGYAALLTRLRAARPGDDPIYAPVFDRDLEEPIAGGVAVPAGVPLVVTEGNYLLADGPGWENARRSLAEVWFLMPADDLRVERLIARHMAHGRSEAEARSWSLGSDQLNAELIAATAAGADLVVEVV